VAEKLNYWHRLRAGPAWIRKKHLMKHIAEAKSVIALPMNKYNASGIALPAQP